jgi:hypothetical protein
MKQDLPHTALIQFISLMSWISVQKLFSQLSTNAINALEIVPVKFLPKSIKNHKIIRKEFHITGERFDRSTMPSIGIGAKLIA